MSGVCLSVLAFAGRGLLGVCTATWYTALRHFQQVNLLASFTACGVLLSATLFYGCATGINCHRGWLVMMGFVLHESQSQTGYLSLVVGEVLLLAVFLAQRRTLLLLLLPLASGMATGSLARHFCP